MPATLTKPQAALLTKAMRDTLFSSTRATTTVINNLLVKGLLDGGFEFGFTPNLNGLLALRKYRLGLWGDQGSMASLKNLEEVDAAIADAQVSA